MLINGPGCDFCNSTFDKAFFCGGVSLVLTGLLHTIGGAVMSMAGAFDRGPEVDEEDPNVQVLSAPFGYDFRQQPTP